MTLQLELTPEQEARLAAAARQEGLAPAEFARQLLTDRLPELPTRSGDSHPSGMRDPELLARVRSIRGKYAHVGVSTDDLHRDRQDEKMRGA